MGKLHKILELQDAVEYEKKLRQQKADEVTKLRETREELKDKLRRRNLQIKNLKAELVIMSNAEEERTLELEGTRKMGAEIKRLQAVAEDWEKAWEREHNIRLDLAGLKNR